jgi:Ca2+-binding EF-hand superfamily protein
MTVLGFLSILTFAVCYGGTLNFLSVWLFGDTAADFITEYLEDIHYLLFLVMVVTIIEVFILLYIGGRSIANYGTYNKICQDEEAIKKKVKELDELPHATYASWICDYLKNPCTAWGKHQHRINLDECVIFYSLRREFIMNRSPLPPYKPATKDKWLPANFDYATYQANCLSLFLVKIVNFTPLTWLFLWSLALVWFIIMISIDGVVSATAEDGDDDYYSLEYVILSALWLFMGYVDCFAIYALQLKCHYILEHLVNPSHLKFEEAFALEDAQADKKSDTSGISGVKKQKEETEKYDESTPLVGSDSKKQVNPFGPDPNAWNPVSSADPIPLVLDNHSSLAIRIRQNENINTPLWSKLESQPPSGLSQMFHGNVQPNKQLQLFWFDNFGPDLNIYILRIHLLVQAIFFTVVMAVFIPFWFTNEVYGYWLWGVVYTLLSLAPFPIQFIVFYPTLIVLMSHVASTGLLKNASAVDDVIRAQKTAKLLKLLMMMTRLQHASGGHGHGKGHDDKDGHGHGGGAHKQPKYDPEDPAIIEQTNEISKIFDKYDADGSGNIDKVELQAMMKTFGITLNTHQTHEMLLILDKDHDGQISKEELTEWYLNTQHTSEEDKHEEMKHMVHQIFAMFDSDNSGEITTEEFTKALQTFDPTLTVDEIVGICKDFDENGDGTISLEEFEKVVEEALHEAAHGGHGEEHEEHEH